MVKQFREALESFLGVFKELPLGKKIAIAVVGMLMVVGILVTAYLSRGEDYSILYSNISGEDTLSITQKLKEKNITYKLERAGSVISVSKVDVYQLRLELAGEGLPSSGGVGFELFDKSTFGMTEFVQNLNYRRALQGELQRTINAMSSVKSSRVHIVIPRRNLFEGDSTKATASIVLKLSGGKQIGQEQIDSIAYLVASSVEGLNSTRITIADTRGNLLSSPEEDSSSHRLSVKQLEYRRLYEADLEKRLRTMIERTVGIGKAVVRINASINFKQVQSTQEIFDPASQVARSEQRMEENTTGASLPSGIAGVQSNLPGITKNDIGMSKPANSNKINETINYEINKTIQTIVEPTSQVTKLSVAVLVDGKYKIGKDEDGKTTRGFQPISETDKATLDKLVRSAIGFDAGRKDTVTIESMRFDSSLIDEGVESLSLISDREFVVTMVEYSGLAIVGLLIIFFAVRPILNMVAGPSAEMEELRTFPRTLADMEKELADLSKAPEEKVDMRKRVVELITDNPEQAASLIRSWLKARQ